MLNKIKESVEKYPHKNAFKIEGEYYTYTQFARVIAKVRRFLEVNTDRNENLIGIIYNPKSEIEVYSAIYGTWFAGKGFVPISISNPLKRNTAIIEQAGIKTLLCASANNKITELAQISNSALINIKELAEADINLDLPPVDDNEIAYLLFTSGSTGIPKGVPILRKNLFSFVDAFFKLGYDINENDRFLQMFELTFDLSIFCYVIPLCAGACVYTLPAEGIKFANVYLTLEENEITVALMVPSVLSYLKPFFDEIKLDKLKYSLFCGETLFNDLTIEWSNCVPNGNIINTYGPTEATIFCTIYEWNKNPVLQKTFNGSVCIGKPLPGMKTIVANENLDFTKQGEMGELCLAGLQLTPGYWKNPDKNKTSFFKKSINDEETPFYRTGDAAFADEEGDLMFSGRLDNQVKIEGFRVELGEIEYFTRQFTKASNVAAISSKNVLGIIQIHLFIENYDGNLQEVIEHLKTCLPDYMIPAQVYTILSFPLNVNGKVDRKELLKQIQIK